ncbi:MAG: monofunctional biosynthetic peptidoglycan transglycosylase [candidate division NC10 bacterium]
MKRRRGGRQRVLLWTLASAAILACAFYLSSLPDIAYLRRENPKTTAYIERYKERQRLKGRPPFVQMTWTPIDQVSPHLRHAVVIAEDDMFYQHHGVDWDSIKEAADYDWHRGRLARGASTITQQLARNLYLSPSKNPLRKIKEILIAQRLEKTLSKRRILELYLNVAEWGPGVYGAAEASRLYFQKAPSEITPEEGVALAAALPNPRKLNPLRPAGPKMIKRREVLLDRMRKAGYLL